MCVSIFEHDAHTGRQYFVVVVTLIQTGGGAVGAP